MSSRRSFIKNGCTLCGAVVAGVSVVSLLEACKTGAGVIVADISQNKITVPLLSISDKTAQVIRSKKLDYDILLVRESENKYHALLMKCTHQANPLIAAQNGLYCNLHGSRFDLNGNVVEEPATRPLEKYAVTTDNENIIIHL
jgi:Rieske Fe-S protein